MYNPIKIKKRYLLYLAVFSYILLCQSCVRMRMSHNETKAFFDKEQLIYNDKTFEGKDFKIHYIETGNSEKPTLVFVHGSPGSWDAYKTYLKDTLLLKKYHMIAIDRPGFGYSNFGQAENLATQANRITTFIKTLESKQPIVLIGHSMGGPVIVKMATQNPAMYQHLVILSGAIDPEAEKPENWRSFIMAKPIRYLIPGALRPANDELWWLKQDLLEMKIDLKKIISQVTIIHGIKDSLVPYSNVAFMKREFINTTVTKIISIPDADHFIPWSHFDVIRNALLDSK